MAERVRIIEGTWRCTSCETKDIPASALSCPTCNNPREASGKESDFDFGARTASGGLAKGAVANAQVLERAAQGPDWYCAYCGSANPAGLEACRSCHAKKAEGTQAQASTLPPPVQPAAAPPPAKARRWPWVVLSLVATCGGLGVWATRTHELRARRVEVSWERTSRLEQFTATTKQDWRDQLTEAAPVMPVDGVGERAGVTNVRACANAQRGTRQVPDGTQRVCHTRTKQEVCGHEEKCSVQQLGNGYAKETCHDVPRYCSKSYEECRDETKYRTEPVYALRCSYDTFEWRPVDTLQTKGADDAPVWPSRGALQGPQREVREERYRVAYEYPDGKSPKRWTKEPASEAEFLKWRAASEVTLTVNNLGSVTQSALP